MKQLTELRGLWYRGGDCLLPRPLVALHVME
jgi:hypothetical protein